MSKQSKFKIRDLKVKSFITGPEQIVGGTGSLPTGRICDLTVVDCFPTLETRHPNFC